MLEHKNDLDPFDNLEFSATGKSKKEAQRDAAKAALEALKKK